MSQSAPTILQQATEIFDRQQAARDAFSQRAGWGDVAPRPVGEDCAFRRYNRLQRANGQSVILMEAIPDGHAIATPGHSLHDFIRISTYLRGLGLAAPEIYEADEAQGYVLLQDFGTVSFKAAMENGAAGRDELYALATDVLSAIGRQTRAAAITLPVYEQSHVHTGRRRVIDWYLPAIHGAPNPDGLSEDYLAVWDGIEAALPSCPRGFQHVDYHFENLMWRDGHDGLARCGILDFQGAMTGPLPYDLANLLEDARVDVPPDLRAAMLDRYCTGMDAAEAEAFRAWYRVLATQFHCRVIGQFIRLAVRDGKERYLAHIPRVAGYLRAGLTDPVLAPLRDWFTAQGVDFTHTALPPVDAIRPHIRGDAF